MPVLPNEMLQSLLQQLQQSAQPRPDLIRDPRTQQVATYLGRVVTPEDTPAEVQRRFPQAELETGGTTMQANDLLKAAIPVAFWRRAPAELKASLTYMMNEQPELMRRMLEIPKRILPETITAPDILGSAEHLTPTVHALRMKVPPKSFPDPEDRLAGTATHEATHVLQYPRVLATDPADAGTIGLLLQDAINARDSWVNRISLHNATAILDKIVQGDQTITKSMTERGITPMSSAAKVTYSGPAGPSMSRRDAWSRLTMDEGLATLAEAVREPNVDPVLRKLADQLGLGVVPKGAAAKNWPETLTRGGYRPIE
jgi:hypothetical protein